jgi:hypothetical protein
MDSASMDLKKAKNFILENLEHSLSLGGTAEASFEHTVDIDICNPDHSFAFRLPLHIAVDKAALMSEILNASLRNKLRLKGFHVVEGHFTQPRLVLLLGRRVVGQLYCSRNGDSLQLEIKARPDARDMGNAVLALGPLKYNVHTPLGSAGTDIVH